MVDFAGRDRSSAARSGAGSCLKLGLYSIFWHMGFAQHVLPWRVQCRDAESNFGHLRGATRKSQPEPTSGRIVRHSERRLHLMPSWPIEPYESRAGAAQGRGARSGAGSAFLQSAKHLLDFALRSSPTQMMMALLVSACAGEALEIAVCKVRTFDAHA